MGFEKMLTFTTKDPLLRFYLKIIKNINKSSKRKFYPGSPKIIEHLISIKKSNLIVN